MRPNTSNRIAQWARYDQSVVRGRGQTGWQAKAGRSLGRSAMNCANFQTMWLSGLRTCFLQASELADDV